MGFLTAAAGTFSVGDTLYKLAVESGFAGLVVDGGWRNLVMIIIACVLLYLGIVKGFEPLLLVGIAFGCLLANISYFPGLSADLNATNALYHPELWDAFLDPASPYYHSYGHILTNAGLLDVFYIGVKAGIYPSIIFMGVGAMTDFGPLLANPKTALLGGAAQFGIFSALLGALLLTMAIPGIDFHFKEAASIGIIGGADGPTSIYLTSKLSPKLLGAVAVAAYSYMALVPIIQPPIMKLFTTKAERQIKMSQLRHVGKLEKICFPLLITLLCAFLLPDAAPLIGMLMFGNLMRECGVVERLNQTAQNALINIVTIFLGLAVGSKLSADQFLSLQTLGILVLGAIAFSIGTAAGVIFAKIMNVFSKEKINPLIGAAGVSAVPMAARVANKVGLEANPQNFLLMHAMGPNVAGVIGSAVAAGVLLNMLKAL